MINKGAAPWDRRTVAVCERGLRGSRKAGRKNAERMRDGNCQRFSAVFDGIPPPLHLTVPRTSPESRRSLAVVPLSRGQRYYGETPVGLWSCQHAVRASRAFRREQLRTAPILESISKSEGYAGCCETPPGALIRNS